VAIVLWQMAALALGRSLLLVSPLDVVIRLARLSSTGSFWASVAFSFFRICLGFLAALSAGMVLAFLAARVKTIEIMLWPYMAAVKATPVASFIILCLIWIGSGGLSVFISFLMVLPIIYTNVLQGLHSFDPKMEEMATLFGVTPLRRLYYFHIPQIRPFLLSACGVAIGLSWKAGIAAEVIGIPSGSIGERLYEAKIYFSSADLFAWTAVVVLLSIGFEKMFVALMKRSFDQMEKI